MFKAIGQKPAAEFLANAGVGLEKGRIKVDDNRRSTHEKIWAGGDCISGGEDLTVVAVEDGKLAAEDIHRALSA